MTEQARGSFIVVVGPDGTGKTTLAQALADRLGDSKYFHFLPRPPWRLADRPGPPGELVEKNTDTGNVLLGWVRLVRNVVKARFGYWLAILPALRSGRSVVGDRYLYGYVAQPVPLKFHGPHWLARALLRLIPKPDLVVVLDAPTDVVLRRKAELTAEQVDNERVAWRDAVPHAVVLDSTRPPSALAGQVLAALRLPTRLYPPGIGHVVIPDRPRSQALCGTSLYAPSRPVAQALHRATRLTVPIGSARFLPRVAEADLPLHVASWADLMEAIQAGGVAFDRIALYRRTQEQRAGFSFLAIAGEEPSAFVRVDSPRIEAEVDALRRIAASAPTTFDYPVPLFDGRSGSLRFAAFTPVLSGYHAPDRRAPISLIADEIADGLDGLPKPGDTPPDWRPMHGDLTPWNLRREGDRLVLIDWERVGWGPEGADQTLYWASAQAVGMPVPECAPTEAGTKFWLERLSDNETQRDDRLRRLMEQLLSSVASETV